MVILTYCFSSNFGSVSGGDRQGKERKGNYTSKSVFGKVFGGVGGYEIASLEEALEENTKESQVEVFIGAKQARVKARDNDP